MIFDPGLFKLVFQNSWVPDAVLAVGQSAIAVTEENTLSVLRLTLGKEKTDLQKAFPKRVSTWVKWVNAAHPGVA